jgi:hypothetical protein
MKIYVYFNKFPLYSSKYLDYKDWEKVALLILQRHHYFSYNIIKIDAIKNNMNLKRIYFNWDHLVNINYCIKGIIP